MGNPFKDWSITDADEHNRRIAEKQRRKLGQPTEQSPPVAVHQEREPVLKKPDLRDGPDTTPQSKETLTAGLLRLAESLWSLLPKVGRFYSSHAKEKTQRRFFILIVDHRLKLIDEDNLEGKYIIDGLRYANILPEDNAATCKSLVTQCLAEKPEDVGIQIEIIEL